MPALGDVSGALAQYRPGEPRLFPTTPGATPISYVTP